MFYHIIVANQHDCSFLTKIFRLYTIELIYFTLFKCKSGTETFYCTEEENIRFELKKKVIQLQWSPKIEWMP